MSKGIIEISAEVALLGIDPLPFLRSTDPFDSVLLQLLHKEITRQKEVLDQNLSIMIANEVISRIK